MYMHKNHIKQQFEDLVDEVYEDEHVGSCFKNTARFASVRFMLSAHELTV